MNNGSMIEQGTHQELLAAARLLRRPVQQPVHQRCGNLDELAAAQKVAAVPALVS